MAQRNTVCFMVFVGGRRVRNEGVRGGDFLFAFNSCLDYNFHSFKTSLSYKRRRNEKKITGIAWNLRVDWRFF